METASETKPVAARPVHTLTITLAGIRSVADLEKAIRDLHNYSPCFTSTRIELQPDRTVGSFVAHTASEVTAFLDDLSDCFGVMNAPKSATPVMWPAPGGDRLGSAATTYIYPVPAVPAP